MNDEYYMTIFSKGETNGQNNHNKRTNRHYN